jgi:hypothetical protein
MLDIPTTQKVYGPVKTKTYKYSPANLSIDVSMQGVMPNELMGPIVQAATKIAVAHCPCRMSANILGRTEKKAPESFADLHRQIKEERGL